MMNYSDLQNKSSLIVSANRIDQAIQELARQLNHHYTQPEFEAKSKSETRTVTAYCVMNGGLYFTGQLMRHVKFPVTINYLHATRYGNKTQGSDLDWKIRPTSTDITEQDVLLIDDIFDEGLTLEAIHHECLQFKPKSMHSIVLVDKQHQRKPTSGFRPNFIGLEVEDKYIFGCGMDYKGLWRNLPAIYALKS